MNQPTVEQLVIILEKYEESNLLDAAFEIHALFNSPPRKPLSELHKDRDACKAIWTELIGKESYLKQCKSSKNMILFEGKGSTWAELFFDGQVSLFIHGNSSEIDVFGLVDKIRECGYDAINPTETVEKV